MLVAFKPLEECGYLFIESIGCRCNVVNLEAAYWPRHNLHRSLTVAAPCAYPRVFASPSDFGKEISMPGKEALPGQCLIELLGSIEHHLNYAIDISIFVIFQSTNVQSQPTSQGGSDIFGIKHYSFNCAGFERFFGKYF